MWWFVENQQTLIKKKNAVVAMSTSEYSRRRVSENETKCRPNIDSKNVATTKNPLNNERVLSCSNKATQQ